MSAVRSIKKEPSQFEKSKSIFDDCHDDFLLVSPELPVKEKASEKKAEPAADVECPVCAQKLRGLDEKRINAHIDDCLTATMLQAEKSGPPKPAAVSLPGAADLEFAKLLMLEEKNALTSALIPGASPFIIQCPYPGCNQRMESYTFPAHAAGLHQRAPQGLACPICALQSDVTYQPTANTHLLNHLTQHHNEEDPFAGFRYRGSNNSQDDDSEDDSSGEERHPPVRPIFPVHRHLIATSSTPSVAKSPTLISLLDTHGRRPGSVVDVLKNTMPGECVICLEEFLQGQSVSRLECMCVFHKHCIDSWWQKSNKCPVHKD